MKIRKLFSVSTAVVVTVSLLAGCGGGASGSDSGTTAAAVKEESTTVEVSQTDSGDSASEGDELSGTIEYWSSWGETESQAKVLQEAADAFMKLHPDVKINFTFNGRDNRYLVQSALETGTQIDVMDANIDNIQSLWTDHLLDLSDYMDKAYDTTDGKPYKECVMPSMLELTKSLFDGKIKCIPYIPQSVLIFCNKGIFEEVGITEYPKTWDQFKDACAKIKAAGYIPLTSDEQRKFTWVGYYLDRLVGDERVREIAADSSQWDDPNILVAAKAIEELVSLGYFDPNVASNLNQAAEQDFVINGNIAMFLNGTWLPNETSESTPEDFKWGAFAYPEVENGINGAEAGAYSTYAIAVNKDVSEEVADAAVAFAVYLTTSEYDQMFSDVAKSIPMSLDATWPDSLLEAREVINNYTERFTSQTGLSTSTNSSTIIGDACLKLYGGEITAEQFVEQASDF